MQITTEWELWPTLIEDAAGGPPHGHLNVLHAAGVDGPVPGALERVNSSISALRQYTSLLAYGSGERRAEYTERLQDITASLEAAVNPP